MENTISWTRKELKRRSKEVLHLHYWRLVLITFLLSAFIGSGAAVTEFAQSFLSGFEEGFTESYEDIATEDVDSVDIATSVPANEQLDTEVNSKAFVVVIIVAFVLMFVLVVFIVVAALLVSALVINPLYVGAMRFYVRSFDTKPKFKEVFFAFENRYKNIVSILLLRDMYSFFWSLLFIIPGIVKSYEYSMIPYLLAENPDLTAKEAFAVSKEMMRGQKWNAFVLDISFLGWQILSFMTMGILGIFYVDSYVHLTDAALYRRLKGADSIPENVYYDGMDKDRTSGWY